MIKLIAIAPYDGYAFIMEKERIYLLEPPYESSNICEVSQEMVEKAVGMYEYIECDINLDNMEEVVSYIKDQLIISRKNLGIETPLFCEIKDLLNYIGDDEILEYLRRVREELIPKRKFDVARAIVVDILELKKAKNNKKIQEIAREIIKGL